MLRALHKLRASKTYFPSMSITNFRRLGDLCEILDRKRKPITKRNRKPGPYPYYGATGVLDNVEGFLFDEPLVVGLSLSPLRIFLSELVALFVPALSIASIKTRPV